MTDLMTLAELGRQPIAPEAPCGISAREEDVYIRLKEEVDKLQSPTAPPVNWDLVVDLATQILQEQSKDLLVASYLSRGLFEQQGYRGLEIGLTVCLDLVGHHWEGLFPLRVRGRTAAIDWLAQRLGGVLARCEPTAADAAFVQRCRDLAGQFGEALDAHLGRGTTEIGNFVRALRDLADRVPAAPAAQADETATNETAASGATAEGSQPSAAPAAPPPAVPQPTAPQAPVQDAAVAVSPEPPAPPQEVRPPEVTAPPPAASSTSTATVPTTFTTDAEVTRALRLGQDVIRKAAAFQLGKDLTNPLPYRLNRLGVWMLVTQPPAHQNQATQLQRVDPGLVSKFEAMFQQAQYADLILEVETCFARSLYWLDAHRLTATALEALGPAHAAARQAVVAEVCHFLRRFPTLLDLTFADGTPFADAQTRAWIDQEVTPALSGKRDVRPTAPVPTPIVAPLPSSPADGQAAEPAPWHIAMAEAQRLATAGHVAEGVTHLQAGLRRADSERERFHWRLQVARLCLAAELHDVALAQLEWLDEQIAHYNLEAWEPDLSRDVLRLLLASYQIAQTQKPASSACIEASITRTHTRLCRLDVAAALEFTGSLSG